MKDVQPDLNDLVRELIAHLRQEPGKTAEECLDYLAQKGRPLSATQRDKLIEALAIVEGYARKYAQMLRPL